MESSSYKLVGMAHVLLPTNIKDPHVWKTYFKNEESDEVVYRAIQVLREQVEDILQWKHVKQQAIDEIKEVPDTILQILLYRFAPLIKELPTGHGVGHLSRDLIHLAAIIQDPEIQKCGSVELLVGIIGGIFHDIGNAVIERYDEPIRFSGHAEVGAFLFGYMTKDILPPHLSLLIQFAIASHTNYLHELEITKGKGTVQEKTLIRKPYVNKLVLDDEGLHKRALWITQSTDRLDALGVPFIFRHILTKATSTRDYSHGKFSEIREDELKEFIHQFSPVIRTKEYKDTVENSQDSAANVLEHAYVFYESAVEKSAYSKYDTKYFTSHLVAPMAFDQARFIIAVLAQTKKLTSEARQIHFEKFYSYANIIEPAKNTEEMTGFLRKNFQLLSEDWQDHWVHGFTLLIDVLYMRWYEVMKESIIEESHISDKKIQVITLDLHKRANMIVEAYNPLNTITQPLENLLRILL